MAHLVFNALSLRPGGGLQVLVAMLKGLVSIRADDQFTILYSDANTLARLKTEFGDKPNISFEAPLSKPRNISLYLWQMRKLARHLESMNADLVIGLNHHYPTNSVPQLIYHVNTLRFQRDRAPIWAGGELAERLRDARAQSALHSADANVFESQFLWDLAFQTNTNIQNGHKIYIGLEAAMDPPASTYDETARQNILVLTSPQPHKDNETLLRAFSILRQSAPDRHWHMQIAGGTDKSAFSTLQALADSMGISGEISWLGFQPHEDLRVLGAQALCLASSSLTESFSMVALEAMSWSCPVVVTNAASMPESLAGAGLLATPKSPEDFARQILSLADNPALRQKMITLGHARSKELTWAKAGSEFNAIIETIL